MNEYRIRATGKVKTQGEIRRMHPHTSFPRVWLKETLEFIGVDPVIPADKPEPSTNLKIVVRNGIEQNLSGEWQYAWVEEDKFSSPEDEQEYLAGLAAAHAQSQKQLRDMLLLSTDFWALSDRPSMTAEQAAYRQALRDITVHPNFPYLLDEDWPMKPD